MSVLSSLPPRPLTESEVVGLNRADSVDLAVAVDDEADETTGLLLATEGWVKGLALDEGGWSTVETVDLTDSERFDALRTAEDAIREQ